MSKYAHMSRTGTKPIRTLSRVNLVTGVATHTAAGEKLRQKAHWVQHRMLFDLLPLFEDDEPVKQVHVAYIATWFVLCSHSFFMLVLIKIVPSNMEPFLLLGLSI